MTIQGSKIGSSEAAATPVAAVEHVAHPTARSKVDPLQSIHAAQQQAAKSQQDLQQLRDAVAARLDQYLKESGRDVEFSVDDAAHATVITVRRTDTGEVIRQYPSEEALALLRRLNAHSGTFLDLMA
jgi:flagellar protein FlaG